ncbi:MAG TPA: hypothetical protein VFJ52_07755 [Terriglobia bacterium]|nr:hypothetical protein [Terriglobia bacterium]
MKNRTKAEKIGVALMAGFCLLLVYKLVSELMGNPPGVAQPETRSYLSSPNSAQAKSGAGKASSSNPGSVFDMQAIEKFRPKPLPDLTRDPFGFGPPPLTPAQKARQAAGAGGGAMTASSAPAVSHIPLRAIGYSEKHGVGPEAYLADSDDVFVVHDGDVVSKRFKILKITSMNVEVQDGVSGERSQLPIPVVQ